jgi:hypothetical protein
MPVRGRGSILNAATSDRRIALQLPRDRRRCTIQLTRDLSHPGTAGEQDRDLLSLGERQIAPGRRREADRRHPTTLAEPPDTNARQNTRLDRSVLARGASSDRFPEPDPMLPPPRRRVPTPTRPSRTGTNSTPDCSSPSQLLNVRRCDNQLNSPKHLRVIGRTARRTEPIRLVEAAQVHLLNNTQNRPNQVILRQPLRQRRRHQQQLTTINSNEFFSHPRSVLT